jgi:hypothetical protein
VIKIQWFVEHMSATDDNDSALLKVFEETGRPHTEIKQIPFTTELLGFDLDGSPALIYGSCQIVEKTFNAGLPIHTFWGTDWFDPASWVGKRSDLLNEDVRTTTVKELRAKWVDEPIFAKSVRVKALTGMVLEPDKHDHDCWLIEHSELDGDEPILLSPLHKIEREWRFFVIEGEVVTGSTYRKDGYRAVRWPVSPAAWEAANKAVKEWMPSQSVVIDIGRTWAGKYKVIEFNCLASSGFYKSDVKKLVERLEAYAVTCFEVESQPDVD